MKLEAKQRLTAMRTDVQLELADGSLWNTHYNGPFENAQKFFTGKYVSEGTEKDEKRKVVKVHFISTEGK